MPFRIHFLFAVPAVAACVISCAPSGGDGAAGSGPAPGSTGAFVADAERAHAAAKIDTAGVVSFRLQLAFGGKTRLNGRIAMTPGTDRIRVDLDDGPSLFADGQRVWIAPEDADWPRARFDVYTWMYFFALPYKLNDPGTIWDEPVTERLDGADRRMARLTFEPGTGDSHEDWYRVYLDSANRIHAAAYIVTHTKSAGEAAEDPHAIVYSNYRQVEGVPVAHRWTFFRWREGEGLTDTLGEGVLSEVRFRDFVPGFFDFPPDGREMPWP